MEKIEGEFTESYLHLNMKTFFLQPFIVALGNFPLTVIIVTNFPCNQNLAA